MIVIDWSMVSVIGGSVTSTAAALIYIGRSAQTLKQVDVNQQELFNRLHEAENDVSNVKSRVSKVEGICEGRTGLYFGTRKGDPQCRD